MRCSLADVRRTNSFLQFCITLLAIFPSVSVVVFFKTILLFFGVCEIVRYVKASIFTSSHILIINFAVFGASWCFCLWSRLLVGVSIISGMKAEQTAT